MIQWDKLNWDKYLFVSKYILYFYLWGEFVTHICIGWIYLFCFQSPLKMKLLEMNLEIYEHYWNKFVLIYENILRRVMIDLY